MYALAEKHEIFGMVNYETPIMFDLVLVVSKTEPGNDDAVETETRQVDYCSIKFR